MALGKCTRRSRSEARKLCGAAAFRRDFVATTRKNSSFARCAKCKTTLSGALLVRVERPRRGKYVLAMENTPRKEKCLLQKILID